MADISFNATDNSGALPPGLTEDEICEDLEVLRMETLNYRDESALERFKGRLGFSDVRRNRSIDLVQQVGPFRHRADGALKSLDRKELAAQVCLEEWPTLDVGVVPMVGDTPILCPILEQPDF